MVFLLVYLKFRNRGLIIWSSVWMTQDLTVKTISWVICGGALPGRMGTGSCDSQSLARFAGRDWQV